jgi:hypothetical protein
MVIPNKLKWRETLGQWLEEHPAWAITLAVLSFFFIFLPQWGSSVWQLFSEKPFFVWLSDKVRTMQLAFSPNWITAPLGLIGILFIVYLLFRRRAKADESQSDEPTTTTKQIPAADVEIQDRITEQEDDIASVEKEREDFRREAESVHAADAEKLKDLEGEITTLKHDGEVADRTIQQLKAAVGRARESAETHSLRANIRDGEIATLQTKYNWLDAIVEYQRNGLPIYVLVEKCEINTSALSQGKRYLEFIFHVRNYSMFHVSIPMDEYDPVKGTIKFKGDPLSGEAKIVENRVTKLPPNRKNYFKVWQWVNPDEAKDIPETLKIVGNLFDFSEAAVYVKADRFPGDEAAKLELTRGMQNAALENKIIELENVNAEVRREVTTWHEYVRYIEELNLALGACYQAYNQSERRESLSQEAFDNLKMRIAHALSCCPNEPKGMSNFYDELPPIPDSPSEQHEWINSQCFKLRALIKEQHQKVSFDDQNVGSTPNS